MTTTEGAATSSPEKSPSELKGEFDDEVEDATLMLDYAVSHGVLSSDGKKLDDLLVDAIKAAQDLAEGHELPSAADRSKFQKAYRDLAQFLAPVTAETLKATSSEHVVRSWLTPRQAKPLAVLWSRKLGAWTLLFVVVALTGSFLEYSYGPAPDRGFLARGELPTFEQAVQLVLYLLVPFTYGAIGACLYLLKACQFYIHSRQFDPLRISEYYNRMILGGVSGGMIVLLVEQISTGASDTGETATKLSAAALGFLAGYNNDLLFSAIERISNAILPKVGIETVQREKRR